MNKIRDWFKKEYVQGWNWFDYTFLFGLLLVQLVVSIITFDAGMGFGWNLFILIASFIGTLATIICSKGKMSYYIWGFIQTIMFLVLNLELKLWVESAEQIYYLVTMIIGVFVWKKNIGKNESIEAKVFNKKHFIITVVSLILVSTGIYFLDKNVLHGNAPLLDTLSLSIAVVANILCTYCYKEQWILWFVLDVVQTILYFSIGQPIMAIMYIGWTINTVYGYYQWNKNKKLKGVAAV